MHLPPGTGLNPDTEGTAKGKLKNMKRKNYFDSSLIRKRIEKVDQVRRLGRRCKSLS